MRKSARYKQRQITYADLNAQRIEQHQQQIMIGKQSQKNVMPSIERKIKQARLNQPFVLKRHLLEAQIKHNETAKVTLHRIRINALGELFYCPMIGITKYETIIAGDDTALPRNAAMVFEKELMAKPGYYDLKNVLVHCNGKNTVIVLEESELLPL